MVTLSPDELNTLEAGIERGTLTHAQVYRLIAEIRRLDIAVNTSTCYWCGGVLPKEHELIVEHIVDCEQRPEKKLAEEIMRLVNLIVAYATTPMTFEQFLEAALGEARTRQIMGTTDEAQADLLEQWHARM